jgi:hypothetical protein
MVLQPVLHEKRRQDLSRSKPALKGHYIYLAQQAYRTQSLSRQLAAGRDTPSLQVYLIDEYSCSDFHEARPFLKFLRRSLQNHLERVMNFESERLS